MSLSHASGWGAVNAAIHPGHRAFLISVPLNLRAQYRLFDAAVNGDMGWFTPIQNASGRAGAAEHGVEHQPASPAQ
jgi:hypothetical protein